MIENTKIAGIRREYSLKELSKSSVNKDPFVQFEVWMNEALNSDILDPSAMILATAAQVRSTKNVTVKMK